MAARLGPPTRILQDGAQRLRRPGEQLTYLFRGQVRDHGRQLERLARRLTLDELRGRWPRHARTIAELSTRQECAMQRQLDGAGDRLRGLTSLLASLSYQGVLARGFALIRDDHDRPVTSARDARGRPALELEFHDGRVSTMVVPGATAKTPRPGESDTPGAPKQGRLL
jgi:exodeoxyribonuclease VII large subunit